MKRTLPVLLLFVYAVLPIRASTYSAAADFGAANPSGAWSYGYAAAGNLSSLGLNFTLMPTYTPNCASGGGFQANCWSGDPAVVGTNGTFQSGTVNYVSGYINLHPGSAGELAILKFTAPTAAMYTFLGEFADHDILGGNGVDVSAVLGDGTFLLNTTAMIAISAPPVPINFSQALSAGQSVYFALGANGSHAFDSTGILLDVTDAPTGPTAPEPATMSLVAGAAIALYLKRRVG